MTSEKFQDWVERLRGHDWSYQMSDDHRAFVNGSQSEYDIRVQAVKDQVSPDEALIISALWAKQWIERRKIIDQEHIQHIEELTTLRTHYLLRGGTGVGTL